MWSLIRTLQRGLRGARAFWTGRRVRWGDLRRVTPISSVFGLDRGIPIDRYYIEAFLSEHRGAVRGRVLEIGDRNYTIRWGEGRVLSSDVLHATRGNPEATLIGDLSTGVGIPNNAFDCMILTQTLPFIYDVSGAIRTIWSSLSPGGVALVTVPGISQISRYDMDRWGDYWRFTDASLRRLFAEVFGQEDVAITSYGNVLAACAFLQGLAVHELTKVELEHQDKDYQLIIGVRAVRRA